MKLRLEIVQTEFDRKTLNKLAIYRLVFFAARFALIAAKRKIGILRCDDENSEKL